MDDQLTPPEEEQQQQEPSRSRFLDAAREARYSINAPTPQRPTSENSGTPEYNQNDWTGSPEDSSANGMEKSRFEDFKDGYQSRDRGLKKSDFAANPKKAALDLPVKSAQATAANAKRLGTFAKNKKWFAVGGASLATIVPLVMILFWFMLFKNVHIKNLYVTYRWAQFNRGLNKSLGQEIAKAKEAGIEAKGKAETTISEDMTPEKMLESAPEGEVKLSNADPATEATRAQTGAQTNELPKLTQEAMDTYGAGDRTAPKGSTAEEIGKNIGDDIAKQGEGLKGNSEQLGNAVDEAGKLEESGKAARTAASEAADGFIKGGSTGAAQALRAATGVGVAATFYCLFRDIYISTKEQINKVVLGGAMGTAQEIKKTASCQQRGDCSLDQANAMSAKYDDGIQSFTETCGYSRATQTNNPDCKDIDVQYTVNSFAKIAQNFVPGGSAGVKTADAVFDPQAGPVVSEAITKGCKAVTSLPGQAMLAAINVGAIAVTGGGWEAVAQGVGTGVVAAAGTAGGKALITHAILVYRGNLFKDLNPHDMGNLTDMGEKATANLTIKKAGGVKITKDVRARLDKEYRLERIAANQKRSVLAKFFDTKSVDSVVTRAALNTPTTPKAIVGRMSSFFASITNPLKLNVALGNTTLALGKNDTALASFDVSTDTYGIADYAPANVAYNIDAKDADTFYDSLTSEAKAALESKYQKCNKTSDEKATTDDIANPDQGDCNGDDYHKYAAAKFNRTATYLYVYSHNNQVDSKVGGAVGSSSSSSSDNAVSGPPGTPTAGQPCPAGTKPAGDAYTANKTHIGLCDVGGGTVVNVSAAKAFYNMIQAAAKDRITLYGRGFRSYDEQVRLRKAHCSDWVNDRAGACRPPTAKAGTSNHEEGLAVDFKNSSTHGTPVYAWLAAHAAQYGIKNLESEPWHWSVNGH